MIRILFFTFLLIFADNDKAVDGNKAYEAGEYQKAEALYREALNEEPENAQILFNLATTLAQQGKSEEAVTYFEQFKSMVPDDAKAQAKANYNIGNTLAKTDDWGAALSYFKEALKNNPEDQQAKINYELAYKKKQEQEQQNKNQQNDNNNQDNQDQDQKQNQQKNDQDNNSDNQNKDQNEKGDQQNPDTNQNKPKDDKREDQNQQQGNHQNQGNSNEMKISQEQAQKILKALENQEKNLLKRFKKPQTDKRKANEKDW